MPIHLRAEPGDYAPSVLCPGDPRRATYIAETFFDPGFRVVNEERGMLGFTGTFDGKPISVQTTGMGCPSAGIVFEELVMLGATRLLRVGTCGALKDGARMADTVIALSATADDQNRYLFHLASFLVEPVVSSCSPRETLARPSSGPSACRKTD